MVGLQRFNDVFIVRQFANRSRTTLIPTKSDLCVCLYFLFMSSWLFYRGSKIILLANITIGVRAIFF